MSDIEREIVVLVQANCKSLVEDWLRGIRDKVTRAKIERQIDKLSRGRGEQKNLKSVSELKIDLGPGYRVYYHLLDGNTLVVLIGGGDKSSQSKDIENARQLRKEFVDGGYSESALRSWKEDQQDEREIDT